MDAAMAVKKKPMTSSEMGKKSARLLTPAERSARAAAGARALNKTLTKAQRKRNASRAGKAGAKARWGARKEKAK